MRAPESGLDKRARGIQLVELLICAHVHVDHIGVGCTRYLYHRIAVDGGVGSRGKTVEHAERRHGEEHSGVLCQVAVGSGSHAGLLLETESIVIYAHFLHRIGGFCDRNADKSVDMHQPQSSQSLGKNIHACHLLRKMWRRGGSRRSRFYCINISHCVQYFQELSGRVDCQTAN